MFVPKIRPHVIELAEQWFIHASRSHALSYCCYSNTILNHAMNNESWTKIAHDVKIFVTSTDYYNFERMKHKPMNLFIWSAICVTICPTYAINRIVLRTILLPQCFNSNRLQQNSRTIEQSETNGSRTTKQRPAFQFCKMTQLHRIASLLYAKPLQKSVSVRLC